jgi:hypothetical protein
MTPERSSAVNGSRLETPNSCNRHFPPSNHMFSASNKWGWLVNGRWLVNGELSLACFGLAPGRETMMMKNFKGIWTPKHLNFSGQKVPSVDWLAEKGNNYDKTPQAKRAQTPAVKLTLRTGKSLFIGKSTNEMVMFNCYCYLKVPESQQLMASQRRSLIHKQPGFYTKICC